MIFALLLFGCADDGGQCELLPAPARHYEAKLVCESDAEMALQSDIALRADWPIVEARCVPVSGDPSVALNSGDPDNNRPAASLRVALTQPRPR